MNEYFPGNLFPVPSPKRPEGEREKEKIQLEIRRPDGDKGFMIVFEGRTSEECMAYNMAIRDILTREGLLPFHQKGVTPSGNHEPGLHGWEVMKPTTEEHLRSLFSRIETEAHELL